MSKCQQRILAGKPQKLSILDEAVSSRLITYPENSTIRYRIRFCMLLNWFQNQHRYMSKCLQRILAGKPQKLSILDETLSFRAMTCSENTIIRYQI